MDNEALSDQLVVMETRITEALASVNKSVITLTEIITLLQTEFLVYKEEEKRGNTRSEP